MSEPLRIAIDIQALQGSSSRGRGIGRYIEEQVHQLVSTGSEKVHSLLVNPNRAITPELEPFIGTGLLRAHQPSMPSGQDGAPPNVYYITSPFELDLSLDEIWPSWARGSSVKTVVTLFDVIPIVFSEQYLGDAITESLYWARLELVRDADMLLCISEATARDAEDILGIHPSKLAVIGTGVSDHFSLPDSSTETIQQVQDLVPGLRRDYILYTGGIDYRKNIEGLLEAYSLLSRSRRRTQQLVIVCRVLPAERERLENLARRLGIGDNILLTGYVPDATLALLYQRATLFVFPSLYEGFGLPIAEAILSGTLSIASDTSSMVEVVKEPGLRFDPHNPQSIARCIENALDQDDPSDLAARQLSHVAKEFTWDTVAVKTIAALDGLDLHPSDTVSARSTRPRLAIVSPLPPVKSGIADYSWRLAHALASHVDVDLVSSDRDAPPQPADDRVSVISEPGLLERHRLVPYDQVIYVMGNSEFHGTTYDLLEQLPGSVMIHEARFVGFFGWYAMHHGLGPVWYQDLLHDEYDAIADALGSRGWLTYDEAASAGVYLLGPLIDRAERILATSEYTAEIALLHRPSRSDDIVNIGFGYPETHESAISERAQIIATFGFQDEIKSTDLVIKAFAMIAHEFPELKCVIVGDIAPAFRPILEDLVIEHELSHRVIMTGRVDSDVYESWLARADIAVQLRRASNGEVSAAVGDCLRFGVPTIVTALGPTVELPDDVVVRIPPDVDATALAAAIQALTGDPEWRSSLAVGALSYIDSLDFESAALSLLDAIGLGRSAGR